ncbi:MAG: methyltransferase domain-containing protein [Candidatus Eremiobacteraeota bacterium]|nr:methyltransferase domain-containing protein [Candidatus Eremiobacteraeota bacterium]
MSKLDDAIEILILMSFREWREVHRVPGMGKVDFLLFLNYFWRFPSIYIFRERKGLGYPYNNFLYGETPYYTVREIIETAEINENDVVYDLGCGRGKFLFFTRLYTGARCIGVDLISTYIKIAQNITEKAEIRNLDFFEEDILNVGLSTATVVFVNGTYFSPETHEGISLNIGKMKPGTRFISSSVEYDNPGLEHFATRDLIFSWARTPVYFYRVK